MNDMAGVPTTSEAVALASILEWSAKGPCWQRDALRRIYLQETLEQTDLDELYEISKGFTEGIPLEATHLKDPSAGDAVVTLRRLHGLKNVNALAEGEVLAFSKKGMTVVYGDNGAGKSGYARVLKHLCRARKAQRDIILPNVYLTSTQKPSACVDFAVGQQQQKSQWVFGTPADARLSAVSVFDSSTANIHVDGANNLAYTPVALGILAALADTCKVLSVRYQQEISTIRSQTPAFIRSPSCKPGTAVGSLFRTLSHKTDKSEIVSLSTLTPLEVARLDSLAKELAEDPQTIHKQLMGRKRRIEKGLKVLTDLDDAISEDSYLSLMDELKMLKDARQVATIASTKLFSNQPLPDVGSDVWRTLWAAARDYSVKHAYRRSTFPNVEDGAHCPLCQQVLSDEAKNRFESFEAFVKGESERQEALALQTYGLSLRALKNARPDIKRVPDSIAWYRDDLDQAELAQKLRKAFVQASWRLRAIIRRRDPEDASELPPLPVMPIDDLSGLITSIDTIIRALTAESDSIERRTLVNERDELADRKWLSIVVTEVMQQIDRLKQISALEQLAKQTATNRISAHTTTLARSHVTDHLAACFDDEIAQLGLSMPGIALQQVRSVGGVPQFQVRLKVETKHTVGQVLSEGEHRCVALAAFLAELATTNTRSAIVFDDPVSSLDHIHREAVARRLAKESMHRQVIILTHDVAFLLLLEEACKELKNPIAYRLISRGSQLPGYCNEAPPNDVLPIDQVLFSLAKHLANVANLHERGDSARWRSEVNNFDVELRIAWERAVEEVVKPVLRRLARKVSTGGLLQLTVLTEGDHKEMRQAYGRLSMLLHNQPNGLSEKLPSPDKIQYEIDTLSSWVNSIRDRQQAIAV
ncbi:AAA family ATPase [Pseudomonas syringae group sp. 247E2]|uniref:AAA family ATPase n=1 Tax=Pseudomonas syringae group sp. 247E2 TaxID=3079592 RepID=UPI00290CE598|nr:AAA family ATPase [Pseudomonas syringae group sp. 247E2]MDU8604811.1 AAA family ATPase [Pseudomonas syringae group sp. 247E2]